MQRKTRNIVLLFLLALLFGAHILAAQTGTQFLTVEGTGGDTGTLTVQFQDAATNVYYATYRYGVQDTPISVATALAGLLNGSWGPYAWG